jgi:CBS domain-containing protein
MMNPSKTQASDAVQRLESIVDAIRHPCPPTVSELMTTEVVSCRAGDTLNRCAQIMWAEACGSVPVVDDDERPVSIITDRDVCMAAYIQGKPLSEIGVASAMSKRLLVVNALDSVSTAEAVMRRHGVRRLLVVDDSGRLVGLLSIDDIIRHGHFGPLRSRDPLSAPAIADTVAALSHASSGRG